MSLFSLNISRECNKCLYGILIGVFREDGIRGWLELLYFFAVRFGGRNSFY